MIVSRTHDLLCDFLPNVAASCVFLDALAVQFQDRRFAPNFLFRAVPSRCAGDVAHFFAQRPTFWRASSFPNSARGPSRPPIA